MMLYEILCNKPWRLALCFVMLCVLVACGSDAEPEPTATPPPTSKPTEPAATPTEATADPTATVPAATATPDPGPTAGAATTNLSDFTAQLNTALATRDLDALSALMSPEFAAGPWRSEWTTYTPDEAAELFLASYLAPEPMITVTSKSAAEITETLGGQPAAMMLGPDIEIAGFLQGSGWGSAATDEAILFVTREEERFVWKAILYTNGTFVQSGSDLVAPPSGLVYSLVEEGLFVIEPDGGVRQLSGRTGALPSPDGSHVVYQDENGQLVLINAYTGTESLLRGDLSLAGLFWWGDRDTLLVGVWLDPAEAEGPNVGHLATLDIFDGTLTLFDETRLSGSRPDMSADGEKVAFDLFQIPPFTGRIYTRGSGVSQFIPANFVSAGDLADSQLFNPAWSPDGEQIAWLASTGERYYLLVFDLVAETVVTLFDWDPARFGGLVPAPQWSPDRAWIALEVLANGPEGSGLWLFPADGSAPGFNAAAGRTPVWVSPELLAYYDVEMGTSHLLDVNSFMVFQIDLPAGSAVTGFVRPILADADIPVEETTVGFLQAQQNINIHGGPGSAYSVIGAIAAGQTARVTGASADGLWWRVICPNDTIGNCWVSADPGLTAPAD